MTRAKSPTLAAGRASSLPSRARIAGAGHHGDDAGLTPTAPSADKLIKGLGRPAAERVAVQHGTGNCGLPRSCRRPVAGCLLGQARLSAVVGHELRLRTYDFRKLPFLA